MSTKTTLPNILKELSRNQIILLKMDGKDYSKNVSRLAKKLSGKKVCYVTMNQTFDAIKTSFAKSRIKIDKFVFIDAISSSIKKIGKQEGNCYYVSSPGALTEISIAITKFLKYDFDYLIFDSVTNLMIYRKPSEVEKFMSSISGRIHKTKTKSLFYAIDISEHKDMLSKCSFFMDETISLEKKQ